MEIDQIIAIITKIVTIGGGSLGIISFIAFYSLKKQESKSKTEGTNIDTLTKVVKGLENELERKDKQLLGYKRSIDSLESGQASLKKRVNILEKKDNENEMLFSLINICKYNKEYNNCPIIKKREELKK